MLKAIPKRKGRKSKADKNAAVFTPTKEIARRYSDEEINTFFYLNDKEKDGLRSFYESYEDPKQTPVLRVGAEKQLELFNLFLNGYTCSEIYRSNKTKDLTLGQIVICCVEGKWHEQRLQYITDLFNTARTKATVAIEEGISFMVLVMNASHKYHRKNLEDYIKTGNLEELQKTKTEIASIRQYKDAVDTLLKLVQRIPGINSTTSEMPIGEELEKKDTVDVVYTDIASLARMKKYGKGGD